jgi:hypothetical protein
MSSALLYVAIVAVWGIVLVPMWLRRDGEGFSARRLLHRRSEAPESLDTFIEPEVLDDIDIDEVEIELDEIEIVSDEPVEEVAPSRRTVSRATVIARRRRRTLGLGLFTVVSAIVVSVGVVPWWSIVPSVVLLGGHLSLLRVAVQIDGIRRQEAEAARVRVARSVVVETVTVSAQEAAEAAHQAEIIELAVHNREAEVYDQYADMGRAVGD